MVWLRAALELHGLCEPSCVSRGRLYKYKEAECVCVCSGLAKFS